MLERQPGQCAGIRGAAAGCASRQPVMTTSPCHPGVPCRVCIDSEHRAAEAMGVHRPRLLATRPAPSSRIPDDPPGKEVGAAPQH